MTNDRAIYKVLGWTALVFLAALVIWGIGVWLFHFEPSKIEFAKYVFPEWRFALRPENEALYYRCFVIMAFIFQIIAVVKTSRIK